MKRARRVRRRKVNNIGMTLVEVVIAMAILSIVIVPMMSIMITSSKYNAKARLRQGMTITAESLMETFKGYSLEELYTQATVGNGVAVGFNGFPAETVGGVQYEATYDSGDDKYEFEITNLPNESQLYDVKITATPYGSTKSLLSLDNMNCYTDAMIRMQEWYDSRTVGDIELDFISNGAAESVRQFLEDNDAVLTSPTLSDVSDDYLKCVKRVTTLNIVKGATDTNVECKIKYYYFVDDYPYYSAVGLATPDLEQDFYKDETAIADEDKYYTWDVIVDIPTSSTDLTVYQNSNEAKLQRVFLYYYPAYPGIYRNGSSMQDVIQINTDGFNTEELDVYVLKQMNPVYGMSAVSSKDRVYGPAISVNSTKDGASVTAVELYHNLTKHLYSADSSSGVSIAGCTNMGFYMSDAHAKASHQLMHNVVIEISEHGSNEVIASLSGTIND